MHPSEPFIEYFNIRGDDWERLLNGAIKYIERVEKYLYTSFTKLQSVGGKNVVQNIF